MFKPLRMIFFCLLSFLINPHLASLVTSSSSSSSSSSSYNDVNSSSVMLCHEDESSALLAFKNSMTFDYSDEDAHYTTRWWKKGTDCCEWDGISCDPTSHHVVQLDLMNSGLIGNLHSNSTLFLLRHLSYLDLSTNDFSYSPISPLFGVMFPHLQYLDLGYSNFSGQVPLEISQLSKLQTLILSSSSINLVKMSNFNKIIANLTQLITLFLDGVNLDSTSFPSSLTNSSSLQEIFLSGCNLRGELPFNILNLPQLVYLYLNNNKGLHAHFPLSNWSSPLEHINLSSVNFSSKLPSSAALSPYYQLQTLSLSGCNFHDQIPAWVWNITIGNKSSLWSLDLSDNNFSGNINLNHFYSKLPDNLHTTSALNFLNLSHNYLTGSLSFPWTTLRYVDISNNKFTGPLHSSLCNLTSVVLLDLSNNSLHDELPYCLGNLSNDLQVLNLGSNTIHGTLPVTFSKCNSLQYLDLSTNWLQGLVPPSLAHCGNLQLLNLRGNKLRDKFPHLLGTLSSIQVLDLSSNGFHGSLMLSKVNNLFPKLQILDLSNNNFSGKIPLAYIKSFRAMMNITRSIGTVKYMEPTNYNGYFYSITLTFNGIQLKYVKIIESLATFDLSNNRFEGEIPENIGELVSIHGLNLSHNHLSGSIPRSLGNLTLLNCLDLSSNKFTGQIPQELTSLIALGVFNVSENQLVGPIPHGKQFDTFSMDSYKGNLRLCGFPLPECGGDDRPRRQPSKGEQRDDDSEDVSILLEWKVIMMGYGFGTVVGSAWGYYMLSIGRPFWLVKLVYLIELILRKLFGRRRRRPTRGRN